MNDVLLPPLSILLPLNRNLDEKFFVLKPGPKYEEQSGYNTIGQALQDGAVVMAYGCVPSPNPNPILPPRYHRAYYLDSLLITFLSGFIRHVVSFLCLGAMLYFLASLYEYFSKDDIIKCKVKCRYCRKQVSAKVRC